MRKRIEYLFNKSSHPLRRLGQWARKPARDIRRARRYRALARFAERRRKKQPAHSKKRKNWDKRRTAWNKKAKAIDRRIEARLKRRIIPRSEWGARPPKSRSDLAGRSGGLFVHHTVGGSPSTEEGEKAEMRAIQNFHQDGRDWADIAYSFIVFPSGRIYEGRGFDVQGAHTVGYNSTAHAVAAAGNYDNLEPSEPLQRTIHWLAHEKLNGGLVRGHRDVNATGCPGNKLYAQLKRFNRKDYQ